MLYRSVGIDSSLFLSQLSPLATSGAQPSPLATIGTQPSPLATIRTQLSPLATSGGKMKARTSQTHYSYHHDNQHEESTPVAMVPAVGLKMKGDKPLSFGFMQGIQVSFLQVKECQQLSLSLSLSLSLRLQWPLQLLPCQPKLLPASSFPLQKQCQLFLQ